MSLFNKTSIGRKPIPPRRVIETVTSCGTSSAHPIENEAVGHRQTSPTPLKMDRTVETSIGGGELRTIGRSAKIPSRNYETIDALDFEKIVKLSNTSGKLTTESVSASIDGLSQRIHESAVSEASVAENVALEANNVSRIVIETTTAGYGTHVEDFEAHAQGRQQIQKSMAVPGNVNITLSSESKPRRKLPQRTLEENDPFQRLWNQSYQSISQFGGSLNQNPGAQAVSPGTPPVSSHIESSEKKAKDHHEKSIEQELFDFRKEEALMQLALGDYNLAEININTLLRDPRTMEGWETTYWTLKRADALQMLGRWQESIELLVALNDNMQDHPAYAKKSYMMAEATYQLRQYQEAKSQCFLALQSYEQVRSTDSTAPHDDFRICIELMARITEAIGADSTEAKFYRSKVKEGFVSRAHLWQVQRYKEQQEIPGSSVSNNHEGPSHHNDKDPLKPFVSSPLGVSSTYAQDCTVLAHSTPQKQEVEHSRTSLSSQSRYSEQVTELFRKDGEKGERVKNWLKRFRIVYSYEISSDIFHDSHRFKGSDEDLLSAFDLALRDRNTEVVETLMYDQHIQWRRGERSGCTALFYAVMNDNSEMIERLVARGIEVNAVVTAPDHVLDIQGPGRPLPIAVKYDKTCAASALLKNNADPNGDADYLTSRRMSPLHNAIWNNNFLIVKLLIEHGASQEVLNHKHLTPLQLAAELGRLRLVELLLDNGAWIGSLYGIVEGAESNTPLHLAAMKGHIEVVELLLSRDASVHYLNEDDLTPLQLLQQTPEGSVARNPLIIDILTKETARQ